MSSKVMELGEMVFTKHWRTVLQVLHSIGAPFCFLQSKRHLKLPCFGWWAWKVGLQIFRALQHCYNEGKSSTRRLPLLIQFKLLLISCPLSCRVEWQLLNPWGEKLTEQEKLLGSSVKGLVEWWHVEFGTGASLHQPHQHNTYSMQFLGGDDWKAGC